MATSTVSSFGLMDSGMMLLAQEENLMFVRNDQFTLSALFPDQVNSSFRRRLILYLDRQLCGPINIDEMECADGFGCCWDPEIDQCFRPESTFQCLEMGGTCKPKDYIDCNRGIGPGADVCPQVRFL